MSTKNKKPAFPTPSQWLNDGEQGLSKLEYVATALMTSVLAMIKPEDMRGISPEQMRAMSAKSAVMLAKALLAELARESGNQTR